MNLWSCWSRQKIQSKTYYLLIREIRPQKIHPEPTWTGKIRRPRQPVVFSTILSGSDRAVPHVTSNLERYSLLVTRLFTSRSDSIGQNGQNGQNGLLFREIPSGKNGDFIRPSTARDAGAHVSFDEMTRRFSTQNESIKWSDPPFSKLYRDRHLCTLRYFNF